MSSVHDVSCLHCHRMSETLTCSLWKWETYFKCRTETSEAAVTCQCVVLFLYHVTHVVVCEQLIFLLLFLQDFLSITWTWQAILNLYFLNVYILENPQRSWFVLDDQTAVRLRSGLQSEHEFYSRSKVIQALKMHLGTKWGFLYFEFIHKQIF